MVTALYNAFCAYLNTYGSQITGRKLTPATALTVNKKESGSATTVPAATVTEAPAAQSTSETATSATEEPAKSKKSAKQSKSKTETATTTTTATAATDVKETLYYVQVLASTTLLEPTSSELKSLQNVEYYKEGGFYKYVVYGTISVDEAKKQLNIVRERFPEAFIVKMEKGCRVGFIKP
jgi:N-acetylmuramoyl-L-alanine amidase